MKRADSGAIHLSDVLSPHPAGFAEEDSSVMSWSHDCDSFLLHCSADHSSLVPGLKSCCAQENKMGVRNSQHRNLHTGAAQLHCLFFSRANIIGEELPSLCIFLFEEFKAGKQALFSKVDCGVTQLYFGSVYLSVCLPFIIQCEHRLPSQSY